MRSPPQASPASEPVSCRSNLRDLKASNTANSRAQNNCLKQFWNLNGLTTRAWSKYFCTGWNQGLATCSNRVVIAHETSSQAWNWFCCNCAHGFYLKMLAACSNVLAQNHPLDTLSALNRSGHATLSCASRQLQKTLFLSRHWIRVSCNTHSTQSEADESYKLDRWKPNSIACV